MVKEISYKNKNLSNLEDLEKISNDLRISIIQTSYEAKIPHLGSCLSCLDILVYLYWEELYINVEDPNNQDRDRFLLSKGHGAPGLFQVLAEKNFFNKKRLEEFGKAGSVFHEHPPKPGLIPGVEAATGSLGHGFPMSVGIALAGKLRRKNYRTYTMLSDGECNEGSIWEAAMLAPNLELNKLTAIIDYNKWQATGRSNEIMNLEPLVQKWETFGWHTQEINGHDFNEMKVAFNNARSNENKPSIIIAHTVKGKGVSFMEDDNNWHYKTPNKNELEIALNELKGK